MMDYISRDALLTHGHAWLCYDVKSCDECPFSGYGANPECKLSERISSIPAADVAPVVHAEWVVSRTDRGWNCAEYPTHCKCTHCGRELPYLDRDNYCPHCGAKMDKEENE